MPNVNYIVMMNKITSAYGLWCVYVAATITSMLLEHKIYVLDITPTALENVFLQLRSL